MQYSDYPKVYDWFRYKTDRRSCSSACDVYLSIRNEIVVCFNYDLADIRVVIGELRVERD